jgi:hypothetical protein
MDICNDSDGSVKHDLTQVACPDVTSHNTRRFNATMSQPSVLDGIHQLVCMVRKECDTFESAMLDYARQLHTLRADQQLITKVAMLKDIAGRVGQDLIGVMPNKPLQVETIRDNVKSFLHMGASKCVRKMLQKCAVSGFSRYVLSIGSIAA